MAKQLPKQSPTTRLGNTTAFVRAVKPYLAEKNWTQKKLSTTSDMSEAMISRMFKNTNGRGDSFDLTERMVAKIAAGLCVGVEGYLILMEAAFSEYFEALRNKENTQCLNISLKSNGKPPL